MIRINKKYDRVVIVIHEIYGINEHMENVCKKISESGFDVICPNLLEREIQFDYSEEKAAYYNFMENVGFTNAYYKLTNLILNMKSKYEKVFIIGFSVGATIAWLYSEEKAVDGIVGYYGSRIRDYIEVCPKCPVMLFFPQEEKTFNIDELILNLSKKSIIIHQFSGKHGFSDPFSSKYNKKSAEKAFNEVMGFFRLIK